MMFSGTTAPPGQVVFANNTAYGGISTTYWTVPAGVYSICAVVVSSYNSARVWINRGATILLSSTDAIGGVVGGGNGGAPGSRSGRGSVGEAGAGGAGGYSGHGGNGGRTYGNPSADSYGGNPGDAGSGGGGGGGGGSMGSGGINGWGGGAGGGVGLLGIGANGNGGAEGYGSTTITRSGNGGGNGSPAGKVYGAGYVSAEYGSAYGGSLRYRNDIQVTPGEVLTIGAQDAQLGGYYIPIGVDSSYGAGVRIMWGGGRSYPSNAGNI